MARPACMGGSSWLDALTTTHLKDDHLLDLVLKIIKLLGSRLCFGYCYMLGINCNRVD